MKILKILFLAAQTGASTDSRQCLKANLAHADAPCKFIIHTAIRTWSGSQIRHCQHAVEQAAISCLKARTADNFYELQLFEVEF